MLDGYRFYVDPTAPQRGVWTVNFVGTIIDPQGNVRPVLPASRIQLIPAEPQEQ